MNYRHSYHAGNCADVVKHLSVIALLESLLKKDKPFCYIDTHAGAGIYDLQAAPAQKTGEYLQGIAPIFADTQSEPLQNYLNLIRKLNLGELTLYPGSPWLALNLLRETDKAIINELHPEDYRYLKRVVRDFQNVAVHERDAYEFLPAILPPNPARGMVLIDPPFEDRFELQNIVGLLKKCQSKWAHGIYLIWLPLKQESLHAFYKKIHALNFERAFVAEITWDPLTPSETALLGCSLIFLNLPFQLETLLPKIFREIMPHWQNLNANFVLQPISQI